MTPTPARVRFAPSPTGRTHIGGARTALYDYLLARQTGGQFILRIEDTDTKRTVPGAEQEIMDSLRWLGLEWDEGPDVGGPHAPYRQSERRSIYQDLARKLIEAGHAYTCFCSPERLTQMRQDQQKRKEPPHYDGLCRSLSMEVVRARLDSGESAVVRFRTPKDGTTTGVDFLRGPITVENATIDDYVLLKSDGLPVYHLAAMADDHLMEITHVFRSSEWLPTFPLHVLVVRAFGWAEPIWVHLSVFLNPTGKGKMSKRHAVDAHGGAMSIYPLDLRAMGYLPEAVNNWLALMGWSYDDHTEVFSLDELVAGFSLERLNPKPAAVNFSKLDHFNGIHLRNLTAEDLARRLAPVFQAEGLDASPEEIQRITPLLQERIRTLDEAVSMAGFFFRKSVEPAVEDLLLEGFPALESSEALRAAKSAFSAANEWTAAALEAAGRSVAEQLNMKPAQLFTVLRVAITGQRVSPPLFETMEVVGRQVCLARIESAAHRLSAA